MPEAPRDVAIAAGDTRLYARWVEVTGAPRALVLLPGLGFHSFEYARLQPLLAQGGLSSLALDYRGHGRSEGPRGDWTLDLLVADARAALDWIVAETARPVVLFGNSLGAMVAIATGVVDARVAAVAASNCPARVGDFLMTPLRRALFAAAKAIAPVCPLRVSVNRFYAYADLIDDSELIAQITHDAMIASARRLSIAAYRSLIDAWDGVREVRRLERPLLLVQGAHDHLQPAEQTDRLFAAANEPRARVRIDTGHLPNLERPALLARTLLDWLATTGSPP